MAKEFDFPIGAGYNSNACIPAGVRLGLPAATKSYF